MASEPRTSYSGMLIADSADRDFAEWMLRKAGVDAVAAAVQSAIDTGLRPFPSVISRTLSLTKTQMREERASQETARPKIASRQPARGDQPPPPPETGIWRPFQSDGLRITIDFAYHPAYNRWWREALTECAVPAYFQGKRKAWVLPLNSLPRVLDALSSHELYFRRDVAQKFAADAASNPLSMAGDWLAVRVSQGVLPSGSVSMVVESGYDPMLNDALRLTNAATWVPASKAWMLDLSVERTLEVLEQAGIARDSITLTDDVLEILAAQAGGSSLPPIDLGPLSVAQPGVKPDADGISGMLMAAAKPLQKLTVATQKIKVAAQDHSLLPHQIDGVHHLLGSSSSLLADDMGLGKTRQAIVACIVDGRPTMVLCPATLKDNWRREITDRGVPQESVQVLGNGRTPDPTKTWWIANFEIAKNCSDIPFSNLIVDEAHYLKEPSSQRTKDAFRLSAKAERVVLLTATPVLNREEEIWTLLRLGGHPLGQIELRDFRGMHAGSPEARQELGRRLDEWMLRRMKTGTVSIPGKTRIEPILTPTDSALSEYLAIFRSDKLQAMEKMWKLQVWLEATKRQFIVDTLRDLQANAKAIVFSQYLETVDWYMEQLGPSAVRLTGAESLKAREIAQKSFQDDPSVRYFITTFKAGGVGLTLTAANYVLMTSRPWTPAEMEQAEDRANRIGQKSLVQVIIPTIPGTIDEQIARVLNDKSELTAEILHTQTVH